MKKIIYTILVLSVSTQVYAIDTMNQASIKSMDHSKMQSSMESREILDTKTKQEVLNVFEANESLHQAFFDRDDNKIKIEALKVKNAIENISNLDIKSKLTFSMVKLDELTSDKTNKEKNKAYNSVSMVLIHLLKTYDLGSDYNGYSCGMAKKKWVQNSTKMNKVHNAYVSNMMPHCGDKITNF